MTRYSNEEEKFIKEKYYELTYQEIADELDRSPNAIRSKVDRMGLTEEDNSIRRNAINYDNPVFNNEYFNAFVSGFVSGEGSFSQESKRRSYKFEICVSSKDEEIIKSIRKYFNNIGSIHYSDRISANEKMITWQVASAADLASFIIPFFDNVSMFGTYKKKQYKDWRESFSSDYNLDDIIREKSKALSTCK